MATVRSRKENRLVEAESRVKVEVADPGAAERATARLRGIGVDLEKLSDESLARLETMVETWPADVEIPAGAIWAVTSR